ncbi:glycerophosphodiester phosphodiesterase [Pseudalkalibacillus berkeleyi]|uniref:Glycerophosphodiester phosphodiesterase n=1 Tax=Pseudalkalibacillus berkeleyi TaxID=1069813 RepID=A0ABS9H1G3_9BACL|nr:glycerophosphodiester phosphodiesterase [Pseudalkalibacillus berkeleyi]MCF6137790.1 glycerophosphodiester phosphodiesterase [Pseudalkalibacillus berkeleyi]
MTLIFAHRGSSKYAPENTMAAFRKALEQHADGIELDVQLTKDKIPVIIHDESLKRTTGVKGLVGEYTYDEIRCLDAGKWFSAKFKYERIPSLEEFLIWMKPTTLKLNIEFKNNILPYYGMEKIVYDLVQEHGLEDRLIYSSFNHYSLKEMKKFDPNIDIAPLYSSGLYEPWNYVKSLPAESAHPHWRTLNQFMLNGFKEHEIRVRPYTINDPKRMKWLFENKIDAIITDVPDIAFDVRSGLHAPKSNKVMTALQKMNPKSFLK